MEESAAECSIYLEGIVGDGRVSCGVFDLPGGRCWRWKSQLQSFPSTWREVLEMEESAAEKFLTVWPRISLDLEPFWI